MLRKRSRGELFWRYGIAVLAATPCLLVFLAVIFSAWLGGWRLEMLTTGLAVVVALIIALVARTGTATGPVKSRRTASRVAHQYASQ